MEEIELELPNVSNASNYTKTVSLEIHADQCENETAIAQSIKAALKEMLDEKIVRGRKANLEDTELERGLRGLGSYGDGEDSQPWVVSVDCKNQKISVKPIILDLIEGSCPQVDIQVIFDEVASRIFK